MYGLAIRAAEEKEKVAATIPARRPCSSDRPWDLTEHTSLPPTHHHRHRHPLLLLLRMSGFRSVTSIPSQIIGNMPLGREQLGKYSWLPDVLRIEGSVRSLCCPAPQI